MSDRRRRVGDGGRRDRVAQRIAIVASFAATAAVAVPMALSAVQVPAEFSAENIVPADPRFPAPMPTLGGEVELALEPIPTPDLSPTAVDIATPELPTVTTVLATTPVAEPTPAAPTADPEPTTQRPSEKPRRTVPLQTIPTPIVLPPLPPTPPPTATATATATPAETATPTATISAPSPVTPRPDTLEGSLQLVSADRLMAGSSGRVTIRAAADHLGSDYDVTVRISVDGATLLDAAAGSGRWRCANDSIGWGCRIDEVAGAADGAFHLTVQPDRAGPVAIIVVIEATKDGSTLRWGGAAAITVEPAEPEPSYTPESDLRSDPRAAELATP